MTETMRPRVETRHSYGQILKSSALVGGSSVINLAFGILRNKAMAVLLGPTGFGLMGLYVSIADLAQSIAGLGINSSGVRQIAEAVGTGDSQRIARTVMVLRRASLLLGILGAAALLVFCKQVSHLTFGSDEHAAAVSLLSIAVLFRLVSAGQGALLQGMRRISDLARVGVIGGFFGIIIIIPLVFFLRERGMVPALIGGAAVSIVTTWWYSRKVPIKYVAMPAAEVSRELIPLLKFGLAFWASSFFVIGAGYAVRAMVLRMAGVDAAGFYQAAWTLGGLYVGFILQAMGADFYPRLTAVAADNIECNRLVNEQTRIGLLLAGPGVVATLTLAPMVVALFYSAKFGGAVEVLRWICLGMTLRVVTWPMGFIAMAKNRRKIFLGVDLTWTIVNLSLSWICVRSFGLSGAGIAFFAAYVFHGFISYPIVRRLSGFRWSADNRRTGLLFLSLIAVAFSGSYLLSPPLATGVGLLVTVVSGAYSIRTLLSLFSLQEIPRPVRRLLVWLRIPGSGY